MEINGLIKLDTMSKIFNNGTLVYIIMTNMHHIDNVAVIINRDSWSMKHPNYLGEYKII